MNTFDKLFNKIINEEISDFGWNWIFRAENPAGQQIGEDKDTTKELIDSLEKGKSGDKIYIYEMAFDKDGKQKRKRKYIILVSDGNGWKTIWSKLRAEFEREARADDRRANYRPLYKKFIPMAGKGWDYTKPE